MLNIPRSKIRSAALGMVEVSGVVVAPRPMASPVQGLSCYYYSTTVWEWKNDGDDKQWVEIACEARQVPFFLDDNTGRVLVDTRGADLDIPCDFQQEFCDLFFSPKQRTPDSVRTFLARHGVSTRNKIKVQEYCIKPNEALFILGTLAPTESAVGASAIPAAEGGSLGDSHPGVVLTKGPHDKTFLISSRSRQELVGSLGWSATLMIWGGPVIALASLYVLLNITGLR